MKNKKLYYSSSHEEVDGIIENGIKVPEDKTGIILEKKEKAQESEVDVYVEVDVDVLDPSCFTPDESLYEELKSKYLPTGDSERDSIDFKDSIQIFSDRFDIPYEEAEDIMNKFYEERFDIEDRYPELAKEMWETWLELEGQISYAEDIDKNAISRWEQDCGLVLS